MYTPDEDVWANSGNPSCARWTLGSDAYGWLQFGDKIFMWRSGNRSGFLGTVWIITHALWGVLCSGQLTFLSQVLHTDT